MLRIRKITAIMVLALLMSLCAPQALAGDMHCPIAGQTQTPGITGEIGMPGVTGEMSTPGITGDILGPGLDGWIGTGLYDAIASLFS